MLKKSHAYSIVLLLLVMFVSSAAWAATITGSVTNASGRTGRIYVVAEMTRDASRSFGTSIATTGGPFTISGVIPGTYVVRAFVDTQGTAIQHANDPQGSSAELSLGPTATTIPAGTIAVTAPTPALAPRAPALTVYGGTGANYVKWVGARDTDGHPIAEEYLVEWNTVATPATNQSVVVQSDLEDRFIHAINNQSLYYRVTARVGSSSAPSEWVRVVPPTATEGSITGTVTFTGSGTGRLFVSAINESTNPPVIRLIAITNPTSPARYTIPSVPPGAYHMVAFLDRDTGENSGVFNTGDAGMVNTNGYTPIARVGTTQAVAPSIALETGSAATIITTGHGKSETAEWFNLVLTAQPMGKQIVNVSVTGPQLTQPATLAVQPSGQFHTRIPMGRQIPGQSYQVVLTFDDGTTETVTEQVTAVLTAFANPTAPVGNIVFNPRPGFSWTAASPAPANDYLYSIWLTNATTGASVWNAWGIRSTATAVTYGGPNLVDGTPYKWILNITDANGNMAAHEVAFTTTNAPALSSFSPPGGPVGTVVTLTGINFPTNPAPTVAFGETAATVTAVTPTTITTTVPAGATSGTITVTNNGTNLESAKTFYVGQPVTVTGRVLTSAGTAVGSARVELFELNSTLSTTTNDAGNFTLQPVFPGQEVTLLVTASGYVPTYSVPYPIGGTGNEFYRDGALNLTPYPLHLYTQEQLNSWGVTAGRGMIAGQLLQLRLAHPFPPVSGATATTTPAYPVSYFNGTAVTGTSTAANGTFLVPNVPESESYVSAQGQKAAWTFYGGNYTVRQGSVTEGPILGQTSPPSVGSFTPLLGKIGSTVTINGLNFSTVPGENLVEFGTLPAQVTSATATRLTVTVPQNAVNGDISVTTYGMKSTLENQPFTVAQTLTVVLTGAGMVNSDPAGIACSGGTGCRADFEQGSTVTLFPTAEGENTFTGWSGACTGTGNCTVTMSADRTATARFSGSGGSTGTIRIGSTPYNTCNEAVTAAAPGSRIEMQAGDHPTDNLVIDKTLTMVGGYDGTFANNTGFSTLTLPATGALVVQNGELRVDRINVR